MNVNCELTKHNKTKQRKQKKEKNLRQKSKTLDLGVTLTAYYNTVVLALLHGRVVLLVPVDYYSTATVAATVHCTFNLVFLRQIMMLMLVLVRLVRVVLVQQN